MSSGHIIIAGDAPLDLLIYPLPSKARPDTSLRDPQGLHTHRYRRGATLIAKFLNAAADQHKHRIHERWLDSLEHGTPEDPVRSIIELDLHSATTSDSLSLKLKRKLQLDVKPWWHCPRPETLPPSSDNVKFLILQDAEGGFSNDENAIDFFRKYRPRFVLYHMAHPLCSGEVWEVVRRGPHVQDGIQDPENVIVIVSADDLRAEGIELSHGLSWDKTCEDFVEQLGSVGKLVTLVTCAHLIVLFGCDGVIYRRGLQAYRPILFFDPRSTEGEFYRQNLGSFPGIAEAFIAGFATKLLQTGQLEDGIDAGLCAARRLAGVGLVKGPINAPEYPLSKTMHDLRQDKNLIRLSIPSDAISSGSSPNWSLLDHLMGDPAEVARQIVMRGTLSIASRIPLAQFGRLILFDRHEIEQFRTLFNFIQEYSAVPQTKPLSIALFGPRGSGRSFAAIQVARAASRGQKIRELRFDLSKFTHLDDLTAAFHSIRDCTLEGLFPVVYFTSFDTKLSGSPLGWLPHLLAPMVAGKFLDHGQNRPTGPAIFFFGATAFKTYENFQHSATGGDGNLTRAQEFLGCLHGYINMLGPDCAGWDDRLYPVRRAVILRALLEDREPKLKVGDGISIDEGVLDGFLLVPTCKQGIRSLKLILSMSRLNGCSHFERAALPPQAQLDLHVDYPAFMRYMTGRILPESIREELAEKLHNTYQAQKIVMARTNEERDMIKSNQWSHLDEEFRESLRAQADDIPRKLRLISCFLSETQESRSPVTAFTDDEQELLAENEHDRWNAERLQKQWHMGTRHPADRKTPFLIPWGDLQREWRDIDRVMVACYPRILPDTHKIYRMGIATGSKEG
jgi:hypothetical protein